MWQVVQRSTFGIFMKLTLMYWSGSCTCCTRSVGLIMSRIAAFRSWKRVSCFRPTYLSRDSRKAAVFFSIVDSRSFLRALIPSISASTSACCFFRAARVTVRSSSSAVSASKSFFARGAERRSLASRSSYL